MPTDAELMQRLEEEVEDLTQELVDLAILEEHVPPHYTPTENPSAMVVGFLAANEALLLRAFHRRKYAADINVVGLNTRSFADYCGGRDTAARGEISPPFDDYDALASGSLGGDARSGDNWSFLAYMNEIKHPYDFAYLRNPNVAALENWEQVLRTAIYNVRRTGVIVTLIRGSDVPKYGVLLERLASGGITPVFSGKTGVTSTTNDFYDTIGIFQGRASEDFL